MKDFKLNLKENAVDFVEKSLEEFVRGHEDQNPREFKYAIIHLAQGLELFLKHILYEEHPYLIYDFPETEGKAKKPWHTVKVDQAIIRISKIYEFDFKKGDREGQILGAIKDSRNDFIHHEVDLKGKEPFTRYAETFKVINWILKETLNVTLNDLLSEEHWEMFTTIDKAHKSYKEGVSPLKFNRVLVPCPICRCKLILKKGDVFQCDWCFAEFEDEKDILYQLNQVDYNQLITEAYFKEKKLSTHECNHCHYKALVFDHEWKEINCFSCEYSPETFECDQCHQKALFFHKATEKVICLSCQYEPPYATLLDCDACDWQTLYRYWKVEDHEQIQKAVCLRCGERQEPDECEICGIRDYDLQSVIWDYDEGGDPIYVHLCQHHYEEYHG